MRVVLIVLLLSSLFLQAGCAAFGVATRGDLEEERRAARARAEQLREENRILRDRIERLGATIEVTGRSIAEMESTLQGFEDRAAEQRQRIWSQTGDLQVRMAAIEDRLGAATSLSDSLRGDVDQATRAAQAASTEALTVRQDLDTVAETAEFARSRSETLLRAWLEQLRAERERLERQLGALEASLAQWESEVFRPEGRPLSGPTDSEIEVSGGAEGGAAESEESAAVR